MSEMDKDKTLVHGTSFEFLKIGWWVWHVVAIATIFYLGHVLWPA